MRKVYILILMIVPFLGNSQNFYVEKTESDKNFEEPIIQTMKFEGCEFVTDKSDADIIVEFLYRQNHSGMKLTTKGKWSGFLVFKTRENNEISKSKTYDASPTAFNGYNSMNGITSKIIKKDLPYMIKESKEWFYSEK